ncbi:MAG TPA: prepilin-type N-terminal cleavage/methylation domain-containing protein [Candidatus Didemnitutus sp.]|nr:prepilin-type N-terminal cleavage/methylation domain-containing protein [Candidatus Didemnitutus sp.]
MARRPPGFSLVEVVIAVAIFAAGVTTILALLPAVARRSLEAEETLAALRLTDAVRLEMQRLANERGFDALATTIPVIDSNADSGLLLVAAHSSADARVLADESPPRDEFFLVELRRYPAGQLAYSPSAGHLALNARVSWPYRVLQADGLAAATAAVDRQHVDFSVVIQR